MHRHLIKILMVTSQEKGELSKYMGQVAIITYFTLPEKSNCYSWHTELIDNCQKNLYTNFTLFPSGSVNFNSGGILK